MLQVSANSSGSSIYIYFFISSLLHVCVCLTEDFRWPITQYKHTGYICILLLFNSNLMTATSSQHFSLLLLIYYNGAAILPVCPPAYEINPRYSYQ